MRGKIKIFGMRIAYSNEHRDKVVLKPRRKKNGCQRGKITLAKENTNYTCDICGKSEVNTDKLSGFWVEKQKCFKLVCEDCQKHIYDLYFDKVMEVEIQKSIELIRKEMEAGKEM
jgi:hypothetical protein